jgi:hypothetical protein
MPPQFVKPYVKTNKHDMADAEAISGRDWSYRPSCDIRARLKIQIS